MHLVGDVGVVNVGAVVVNRRDAHGRDDGTVAGFVVTVLKAEVLAVPAVGL